MQWGTCFEATKLAVCLGNRTLWPRGATKFTAKRMEDAVNRDLTPGQHVMVDWNYNTAGSISLRKHVCAS